MMPVCELLRKMTIEKGLVDMEIEYHITTPKVHPAQEPWIVLFGWIFQWIVSSGCLHLAEARMEQKHRLWTSGVETS